MKRSVVILCALALVATSERASATIINFDTIATGSPTPITNIGIATFSLSGVGEMGTPIAQTLGGPGDGYLWNSSDSINYPTNTILRVDFSSAVTDVEFDFSPFGINGQPGQGWRLFDSGGATIASGAFTSGGLAHYDLSGYVGVRGIEFNNGGNDWLQGLKLLQFEQQAVPEPATLAVFCLMAAGGLGYVRRRTKAVAAPVA